MSRNALLDAEKNYLWLKKNSEESADKWLKGLTETVKSLQNFPNRCPIANESRLFLVEIRQIFYGKGRNQFRIMFGVSVDENTGEDVVLIYRIRHASQSYLSILEIIGESIDE